MQVVAAAAAAVAAAAAAAAAHTPGGQCAAQVEEAAGMIVLYSARQGWANSRQSHVMCSEPPSWLGNAASRECGMANAGPVHTVGLREPRAAYLCQAPSFATLCACCCGKPGGGDGGGVGTSDPLHHFAASPFMGRYQGCTPGVACGGL
jgi:hypothetical protein